ncbi:MAG: hypothetical protein M1819_006189 [Sarea resinae]|nr:MAG: hypothetical protein M1819_006189 [Sarea resinae]
MHHEQSAYSINFVVPKTEVTVEDAGGKRKVYQDKNTVSGNTVEDCGSPLFTGTPIVPDLYFVKASLFEDVPAPTQELFCDRRFGWLEAAKGAEQQ